MKILKQHVLAHGMALFVAIIWGITYISSKILLEWYTPLEIMIQRFTLAYISLILIQPKFYCITLLMSVGGMLILLGVLIAERGNILKGLMRIFKTIGL